MINRDYILLSRVATNVSCIFLESCEVCSFSFFILLVLIKHCFMLSLPKFKVVPYFIFYFDPIKTEIVLFVLIPIKYRPNFDFNSLSFCPSTIFRLHSGNYIYQGIKDRHYNVLIMTRLYQPWQEGSYSNPISDQSFPCLLETGHPVHNPIFKSDFPA